MKTSYVFITVMTCVSLHVQTAQTPPNTTSSQSYPWTPLYPCSAPITVCVNSHGGGANATNHSEALQQSNHATEMHHTITHKIELPSLSLPSLENTQSSITTSLYSVCDWCIHHKWKIFAGLILTTYSILYYQITALIAKLDNPTNWSYWKHGIDMGSLVTTPAHLLIRELQIDLFNKYYLTSDEQNSSLHKTFMQDLAQEKEWLNIYERLAIFCHKSFLHKLLPLKYNKQDIEEKKSRLQFISNLFASWHIQNNKKLQEN